MQPEIFWRQRSTQLWLQEGDQNSIFFHVATMNRRKVNQIISLQNNEGMNVGWDSGLEDVMVSYFTKLFNASNT